MNEKINQIISNYLFVANTTDYAIMINGPWGCGKTYYLEKELKDIVKNQGLKYVYVSLNGYSNFKSISTRILYHLLVSDKNQNIDEDLIDNLWDLDTKLSEIHPAFNILGIIKEQVKKAVENKKNKKADASKIVIIFDDLERISDDVLRNDLILSVYEKYVKRGYKTIFVGDETKIVDKNYYEIKEKVIRRTISYEPDRNQQFSNFIENKYNNIDDETRKLFTQKYVDYFIELEISNFRTVTFIIDSYLYVLENLDDDIKIRFNDFMFKNILVLTNEYKNGKISISNKANLNELLNLRTAYLRDYLPKAMSENEIERDTYVDEFCKKYTSKKSFHDFHFFNEIYDYILTGYLDKESINKSIRNTFIDISEDQSVFARLTMYYYNLEEKQLKEDIEKMIFYTENGKYGLFKLPYIYTFFIYIKDKKYLANWCYDIEKVILTSIDFCIANRELIPDRIDIMDHQPKYDEKRPNDAFYDSIVKKIKQLSSDKQIEEKKNKTIEIYKCLLDGKNPYELLFNNYSFFYDTIMSNLENNLILLPNSSIRILQEYIHGKLLISNPGEMNFNEVCPLKIITKLLLKLMDENEEYFDNMKRVRLVELIGIMNEAIKNLEK
jgi:hypothetical protein